jgi:hypothetical protein
MMRRQKRALLPGMRRVKVLEPGGPIFLVGPAANGLFGDWLQFVGGGTMFSDINSRIITQRNELGESFLIAPCRLANRQIG